MTNEEAINILRGQESAYWDTLSEAEHKAFDLAVDALTAKQPRVLTLEEVIHSGNDLMWLEIKCAKPPHFMLEPTSPYTDNDERWSCVSFQTGHSQSKKLYGRQWRCWTARPTEEQREATPWDEPPKEGDGE